jgi:hypothetical protein
MPSSASRVASSTMALDTLIISSPPSVRHSAGQVSTPADARTHAREPPPSLRVNDPWEVEVGQYRQPGKQDVEDGHEGQGQALSFRLARAAAMLRPGRPADKCSSVR